MPKLGCSRTLFQYRRCRGHGDALWRPAFRYVVQHSYIVLNTFQFLLYISFMGNSSWRNLLLDISPHPIIKIVISEIFFRYGTSIVGLLLATNTVTTIAGAQTLVATRPQKRAQSRSTSTLGIYKGTDFLWSTWHDDRTIWQREIALMKLESQKQFSCLFLWRHWSSSCRCGSQWREPQALASGSVFTARNSRERFASSK